MFHASPSPNALNGDGRVKVRTVFGGRVPLVIGRAVIPRDRCDSHGILATFYLVVGATIMRDCGVARGVGVVRVVGFKVSDEGAQLHLSAMAPRVYRICFPQFVIPTQVPKCCFFPF